MKNKLIHHKEPHLAPAHREALETLYKELTRAGAKDGKDLIKLALDLDDKGEYWKFKEVFS